MIVSSIGPWALGFIMNTLGNTSSWYRNAIYFYLHFQYNGWFILALFSVLFYVLEQRNILISKEIFSHFFKFFNIGVVLTFAISILWMKLNIAINIIASLGALFQLIAMIFLWEAIPTNRIKVSFTNLTRLLFRFLTLFFCIKLVIQFTGTLPRIVNIISQNIDFAIGYLHWMFLGIVSLGLIGFLHLFKLLKLTKTTLIFYVFGFIFTQILIFYRGFVSWFNLKLYQLNFKTS